MLTLTVILSSCKKDPKKTSHSDTTEQKQEKPFQLNQGKHCYQYIMENSYKKDGKLVTEKDFINIIFSINNKAIEGDYIITSKKGEINNGHFVGNINNDIITTIHTYKNTNKILKDELIFKVFADKIAILGGEKKLIDGVNMFVDKSKCDYMMELEEINCN
jgi:hypothetical protein